MNLRFRTRRPYVSQQFEKLLYLILNEHLTYCLRLVTCGVPKDVRITGVDEATHSVRRLDEVCGLCVFVQ